MQYAGVSCHVAYETSCKTLVVVAGCHCCCRGEVLDTTKQAKACSQQLCESLLFGMHGLSTYQRWLLDEDLGRHVAISWH